ncbi:DUF3857 domain-containing protein [Salegentibacter sp. F188]|uniref:DUF3857 domain-containing protein n=1 Tax=Autumnicola patrickiae TaxID=3075591 RepID=A0ABU3DZM7_9FLAO|nr:DUF3857 domain-containing protein [Salegentibacter sp. F188]MDT0689110.1 DUF3857 domain-containing protein [Salegentibacter sp. F188]
MHKYWLLIFGGLYCLNLQCQDYPVSHIDISLLNNANAVIRNYDEKIVVEDLDKVVTKIDKVITILNQKGDRFLGAYEVYDASEKIKHQQAIVYDRNGKQIKKIRGRDFMDESNFPSFVLFADNRVSYLNYTPRSYPYTIHYTSEVESKNSIFIPEWRPVPGYNISVENSSFQILNHTRSSLRFSEKNMEDLQVEKDSDSLSLHYKIQDIQAMEYEVLSPYFHQNAPRLVVALKGFHLEGINGSAGNWEEFGKWQYENLVKGHDDLPQETINKITLLTKDAKSLEEKARIIYEYVQNSTRYVAIALGIGGWEPAYAGEVDKLGYGDCKGLTNYTMALLKSQDIEAYYTIVHSGEKLDIDPDFTKIQGNHVILNIPREEKEDIWLECTNQFFPFDYLGDFTDDRFVLRLTPEGGEIIKTREYSAEDNLEEIHCTVELQSEGGFLANFERSSTGIPYGDIYPLERQQEKDQKEYYRSEWAHIQNISFDSISFSNNKEAIRFTEKLKFRGDRFAIKAGNRFLLPLNFVKNERIKLREIENRKYPVRISRGKTYADTFRYKIPAEYEVEALPEGSAITSEFGNSKIEIKMEEGEDGVMLVVKKFLQINKGEWSSEKYEDFREFIGAVEEMNNLKAVIVTKS